MHRVTRDDLVTMLAVALRTAPAHVKQQLRSKMAHEADAASEALAKLLAERLDNRSYMVIAAEMVSMEHSGQRIGRWGVDEPDPIEHKLIIVPPLEA